ncbi:pilus assembly protein [Robbsia andropogonis]|nr:TadE/TadG family type IV pilus assembly protein [Robbsia andropogonis]MCP1117557.1 pilus assembly protein [Robbsia andropogonis]
MMEASRGMRATMRAQTRRAGPAMVVRVVRVLAGAAVARAGARCVPTTALGAHGQSAGPHVTAVDRTPSRGRRRLRAQDTRGQQRGVAAVEFALVFPVVFLLVYGLITWALILLAQQTLTLAVGEGARAALRYSTSPITAACAAVNNATTWLGSTACVTSTPSATACPYLSTQSCLKVTASYNYASKPLVPTLPFLNLVLPTTLTASTTVQLEPDVLIK